MDFSRRWALGWSSLIVLRLRHRNCECYRGSKTDSEYGRHLFHRFTYGSTQAPGLRAFSENRQRCVRFLAFLCRHRLRRRAAIWRTVARSVQSPFGATAPILSAATSADQAHLWQWNRTNIFKHQISDRKSTEYLRASIQRHIEPRTLGDNTTAIANLY